jgi:hypothetical protein
MLAGLDSSFLKQGGRHGQEEQSGRSLLLLSARRSGAGGSLSEARVKKGDRTVRGGEKELLEKLGRNDPCPCGSGRRFQEVLHAER